MKMSVVLRRGGLTVTGPASATAVAAVGTSQQNYTATITPNATSEGDVTVKVKASAVTDAAGNNNTASTVTSAVHIDTILPVVTITGMPTTKTNADFTLTIGFSETVTGLSGLLEILQNIVVTGPAALSTGHRNGVNIVVSIGPIPDREGGCDCRGRGRCCDGCRRE